MKKLIFSIALITIVIFGCKTNTGATNTQKLTLAFEPKNNSGVFGKATFTEKDGKVTLVAKLSGLKP